MQDTCTRPKAQVDLHHISITVQDPTRKYQGLLTGDENFLHDEAVRRFIRWYSMDMYEHSRHGLKTSNGIALIKTPGSILSSKVPCAHMSTRDLQYLEDVLNDTYVTYHAHRARAGKLEASFQKSPLREPIFKMDTYSYLTKG